MAYKISKRFILGGTCFADRVGNVMAKHPEITRVVSVDVSSTGEEGHYAADLTLTYEASRELTWWELREAAGEVPLYKPVSPKDLERLIAWERDQRGIEG